MPTPVSEITLVALTGGIGSGKSTFANFLAEEGAIIIDADILAREVVAPGSDGLTLVRKEFGGGILNSDGTLNRTALAEVVFSDQSKRAILERLLHPRIQTAFQNRLAEVRQELLASSPSATNDKRHIVVYVVPLLFETGYNTSIFAKSVAILAPPAQSIDRIIARDSCSRDLAQKKLAAQLSNEEKQALADITIVNDGDLRELRAKAKSLIDELSLIR